MCKFNACGIWKYLNEYEYFMRIDEDVIIKKFDINVFKTPKSLDGNFIQYNYLKNHTSQQIKPYLSICQIYLTLNKKIFMIINFHIPTFI